jgi:predicted phosphodiesterase
MRILVISDIHANLTALDAVLNEVGEVDKTWCLGDLVGYGPDPNECISRIQSLPNLSCILGNHDAAALNLIDTNSFNPEARRAIHWTQNALTKSSRTFLRNLPETLKFDAVTLSHGSPRHPVWEYLLDTHTALINFDYFETNFCFVGHTHLPVTYHLRDGSRAVGLTIPTPNSEVNMIPREILNPGSVGQPRDRDPRSAYAIYETEQMTWGYFRAAYDVKAVQDRMVAVGLPERHIKRLSAGW